MLAVRFPTRPRGSAKETAQGPVDHTSEHDIRSNGGPANELVDLYSAIMIAVPLALFLKWLWP
jgi:hypothetical protein